MNTNALRAYFRAKGEKLEVWRIRLGAGAIYNRHRVKPGRPSSVLRSNIFDVAEHERLRREAVPSSKEITTAEDAAPQLTEQPANVDAAVNTPVVVDSSDDGTVAQEFELVHMRSKLEEMILETRSKPIKIRPRLIRIT
ncbi:unnamed protein product [Parnassius apollo]|uniref:(apollo) hypothetical protein n=1 Tax=Parnassius apollo TaxID=110799 RepID=A0A8S3YF15_PARAO|nr:unnamed protein product [Parnassius apollo]